MNIQNSFFAPPLTGPLPHTCLRRNGEPEVCAEPVLTEHKAFVTVNGANTLELTCLPQYLPELVLGQLLSQGYIRTKDDVQALCIDRDGQVSVTLHENPVPLRPVTPIPWKTEWVFALADRFAEGMPIHGATFATHSCFLAKGGELLFGCEDIGRHNALDKAIGFALLSGIDLTGCLLYSSGRMPTDMVTKAIRAGIPVLVSKGSPTMGAVALAQQYGLTLICAARQDRMKQFSGTKPV